MPRRRTFATVRGSPCPVAGRSLRFGAAHAPSPDVRFGHPALRSLDGGGALGILPSLAANAGSRDMGSPSRIPQSRIKALSASDGICMLRYGSGLPLTDSAFSTHTTHATA